MSRLHDATEPDSPVAERAGRALTYGGIGAGLGATGGYLNELRNFVADPVASTRNLTRLAKHQKTLKALYNLKGGLADDLALHRHLAPLIARKTPGKLLWPALAVGGLGGLAGLLPSTHETTLKERFDKFRG